VSLEGCTLTDLVGGRFYLKRSRTVPFSGVYQVIKVLDGQINGEDYAHVARVLNSGELSTALNATRAVPISKLTREVK
jgi:hypothetical protein